MGKAADRIEDLRKIKEIRDKGEVICIPYYKSYPKLSKFVPGIVKGILYKITANSGIGKTQLTKALFVLAPLNYIKNNPNTKITIKIFYFALEESEEEFIDSLICNQVAYKHKVRVDPMMLKGYREEYLDDKTLALIEDCEKDVDYFMQFIEVIDSVSNPTGMYKYCRTYSEKVGTHHWKDVKFTKKGKDGQVKVTDEKIYDRYEPHDPNHHVITIGDHIGLVTPEHDDLYGRRLTKHEAIAKWSTHYCRGQMTKHWGWTAVNVQQQEESSSKQQYTNSGESIVTKTEPTLDALANNKEVQRDDYVVLSLYSPDRFGFEEYHGYDIDKMRDTFRVIKILKNRLGVPNKYVPLIFDGATNRFGELPFPEDKQNLNKFYEQAEKLIRGEK